VRSLRMCRAPSLLLAVSLLSWRRVLCSALAKRGPSPDLPPRNQQSAPGEGWMAAPVASVPHLCVCSRLMQFACKLDSNLLYGALSNLNEAVLGDIRKSVVAVARSAVVACDAYRTVAGITPMQPSTRTQRLITHCCPSCPRCATPTCHLPSVS
jgi:hypothetical protein